jgi:CBS domain-containing protein
MSTTLQPYHGSYLMPSLEHARVSDVMHPGIIACEAAATLSEVARVMATHHVHCIAVMGVTRNGGEKLVWNIITDLDLLRAGLNSDDEPTAAHLATTPIVTVTTGTPLREAAELMLQRGVSHVIVVDPDAERPTGVLSTLDIAGTLAWGEL